MSDCTDPIPLENLSFCATDEIAPGVSETGVYVAAISDFDSIKKPPAIADGSSLTDIATISETHTFIGDKGFHKLYINPNSGFVETGQSGEKGNLSLENSITGQLQGTGAKIAGWVRKYKNTPLIAIVKERDGKIKQIGSELSPAYISELSGNSGQNPGDVKSTTVKISDTQPYMAPEYGGTITEFTPSS